MVEFGRGHFFYKFCDRTQTIIGSALRQTTLPERLGQSLWGTGWPPASQNGPGSKDGGGGERAGAMEEVSMQKYIPSSLCRKPMTTCGYVYIHAGWQSEGYLQAWAQPWKKQLTIGMHIHVCLSLGACDSMTAKCITHSSLRVLSFTSIHTCCPKWGQRILSFTSIHTYCPSRGHIHMYRRSTLPQKGLPAGPPN